jgi:hypothetical protein
MALPHWGMVKVAFSSVARPVTQLEEQHPEHAILSPVATVVTAYVPSRDRWEADWKTRKRTRKSKQRKRKR